MSILFNQPEQDSTENYGEDPQHGLLIFGYQCKLFRDDERATAIDEGAHLIPWNGDASTTIDRFDGRGHLYDLQPYDGGTPQGRGQGYTMSGEEARIERLCDEERYLECNTDASEKEIHEEEELKRLNQELAEDNSYAAIGFSYDQPTAVAGPSARVDQLAEAREQEEDVDDEVYLPPPQLKLPPSMIYPESSKLNAMIVKTAKYVAQHGGQMEIMIKTKQANNDSFRFLNFEHRLNPYYKLLVHRIKSGVYNPDLHDKPATNAQPSRSTISAQQSDQSDDSDDSDGGYLHPLLFATKTNKPTNTTPSQPATSSVEGTSYDKLLKQMAPQIRLQQEAQQRASPVPSVPVMNGNVEPRPISPPPELRPLIDRLITYVELNGESFEQEVIARNDTRFSFLLSDDPYNPYYSWRKSLVLPEPEPADQLEELENVYNTEPPPPPPGQPPATQSRGISFSIKQKESTEPQLVETPLPVDPDTDEEGAETDLNTEAKQTPIFNGPQLPQTKPEPEGVCISASAQLYQVEAPEPIEVQKLQDLSDREEREHQRHRKHAEELKNKLALATREKMTQVTSNTQEKVLKEERKRKAALFVKMLKDKPQSHPEPIGPELPLDRQYELECRLSPLLETANHSQYKSRSSGQSNHRSRSSGISGYESRSSGQSDHRSTDRTRPTKVRSEDLIMSRLASRSPSPRPRKRRKVELAEISDSWSGSSSPVPAHILAASGSNSPYGTADTGLPDLSEQDLKHKVRQMLKEKRKAVYNEDMFS